MRNIATIGLLLLLACAHKQQVMVTSGETLLALADIFVGVAASMDKGLEEGTVTEEQYGKWAVFGSRFQQTYPAAVAAWQRARLTGNIELQGSVSEMISNLALELATFKAGN